MWACFGTLNPCIEIGRFMNWCFPLQNEGFSRLVGFFWFLNVPCKLSAWQVKKFREKNLESEKDSEERTPEQRQDISVNGQKG